MDCCDLIRGCLCSLLLLCVFGVDVGGCGGVDVVACVFIYIYVLLNVLLLVVAARFVFVVGVGGGGGNDVVVRAY